MYSKQNKSLRKKVFLLELYQAVTDTMTVLVDDAAARQIDEQQRTVLET
jgi:hypothetical protein